MRKFKDIDVVDAIEMMKMNLRDNRLCLLVGAGVSKCACDLYQTWYDFISDMVIYLYKPELESKGIEIKDVNDFYCHYEILNDKEKAKNIIYKIIEREGVLNIPSQFQRRNGIRESIESYVESHIPRIDKEKNTATLFNKTVSLTSNADFIVSMLRIKWNGIFTTNYDNLLEHVALNNGLTRFMVSDCASDLSLRNLRDMIIKLHGNIDFEQKSSCFDSDRHRKYIISQEDYEDYPTKHEAFMQLMKISLLKDCLCIVGFSGKDANFISWINWVREIIDVSINNKDSEYPRAKDIKVFFIDVRGGNIDDATQQYFENHRIYRILLTDTKVINLLGIEKLEENDSERANKLFKSFFDYLNNDKENDIFYTTFNLWAKVYKQTQNNPLDIEIDGNIADKLISYSSYLRILKESHFQSVFINAIKNKNELSKIEAEISLMALEQMQCDCENYECELFNKIENALNDNESLDRIKKLKERHFTLTDPEIELDGISDSIMYECALRYAFTFELKKLEKLLNNWTPSEEFFMRKLILLHLINPIVINGILSQELLDGIQPSVERFRATQIANILLGHNQEKFSVDEYEGLNEFSIFSLRDWYFSSLIQLNRDITAYGVSNGKEKELNISRAIRCLNFLIETPLMPQIGNWRIVSDSQWYQVAHALFEKYPFPILFYSSTMSSVNLLKRIGQDYAYSIKLHKQLPVFVERMFSLITNESDATSYRIYNNICVLLTEMIKGVDYHLWDIYVLKIWENNILPRFEKMHHIDDVYKLICECVTRSRNSQIVSKIIIDCLNEVKNTGNYGIVKDLLYHSRRNHNKEVFINIEATLNKYISSIDNYKDFVVLVNIHRLISKTQYKEIENKIIEVVSSLKINTFYIKGLVYYARSNYKLLNLIKKSLISSDLLWYNGIENGVFRSANFINIVAIDEFFKWTDRELDVVYDKLKFSAYELLRVIKDKESCVFMNYDSLLYDMMRFIDIHRGYLSTKKDLDELYNAIEEKYNLLTGFVSLEKSIFSDDECEMEVCIKYLEGKIKNDGIINNINYINVLITRILSRNKSSYLEILDVIQYIVRFYVKTKEELNMLPYLSNLIDKLTIKEFINLEQNVILCSELAILLADGLRKLGLQSGGISYWINIKNTRYFNWTICENIDYDKKQKI